MPASKHALTASINQNRYSYGIVQTGDHVENGVSCVRVVDLSKPGGLSISQMVRTSEKISSAYRRTVLQRDDIIVALRGEIGKVAKVTPELEGANLTRGIALISNAPQQIDADFLFYSLRSPAAVRSFQHGVNGSALQETPIGNLRNVEILVPRDKAEQREIARVFGVWDRALERLDALLAATTRRKRALMQGLLTGRRRLPNHAGKWTTRAIGEICARVTRRNTAGETHVLTISGREGLIDQREIFNRVIASADSSNYYLLRRGEFAYNKSTSNGYPFGAIKRLDRYDAGIVSPLYICFRLSADDVDPDFLAQWFEAGRLNECLRGITREGARSHGLLNVSVQDFLDLPVLLPPTVAEQRAIARVLDTADWELSLLRRQRAALALQKRGLMQRLLTGKVRVKP